MFLQTRPAYVTLLLLIFCLAFCLVPLSAAAAEQSKDMEFASEFDQFSPNDSARPPAIYSATRVNSRVKSMMLAKAEKTKKKKGKGSSAPEDRAKLLALTAQMTRSHTGLPIALTATVQDANGAIVATTPIAVKLSVTGVKGSLIPQSTVTSAGGVANF